ncbi:MAG: hypothetical protein AAF170_18375, partial [Bacteroidota bacterium]
MRVFLPVDLSGHSPIPLEGLRVGGEAFRPFASLAEAQAAALQPDGRLRRILVLDPDALELANGTVEVIPRTAVLNVDPDGDYWRPATVAAGGGDVVRRTEEGLDQLMIHRRRVWDLPKGKLDPGET